jgi:hypothetical protein
VPASELQAQLYGVRWTESVRGYRVQEECLGRRLDRGQAQRHRCEGRTEGSAIRYCQLG